MSFPRYPEYKDSCVEWLGEVPAHWEVKPVKTLADVINGFPFDSALFDASEGYPLIRIRDLNSREPEARYRGEFVEAAAITSDDVLIGMDGDFNMGRWCGTGRALLNQRMCCVRGRSESVTRFLEYALPIPLRAINAVTYATTVKHLASSQVEKTRVAVPPDLDERAAIVGFLDRETAKIDALVAEQERLIELLKEKRQAVISQAVTKGLNPDAPMKPSGVEWLGEVPAHWQVMPIRYAARLESGHTPSRNHPEYWDDCTVPWFTLADVWQIRQARRDVIFETKEKISELGLANSAARRLPKGTVMLSRTASVGFSAVMGVEMATTQDFANWVCGDRLKSEFLLHVLRSMRGEFSRLMMGSTHNTIYMPDIQALRFALPPMEEQERVHDFLQNETAKFDCLTDEAQRAIYLLQERRAALISAAVTGQLDVRAIADRAAA